ncbi:MAG: NAD+ synthase [Phycisphaeraceae bacterium]|nr:NAD+ synthase [Phycisphaeraceae bacterium]
MRIALAQINPTVGDIPGNAALIQDAIERAKAQGARLVVFPELAIIGYPPKDLLLKPDAIDRCRAAVERIAKSCTGITAVIGLPVRSDKPTGRLLHNAAALCADGKIASLHLKHLLPTYDVFDEQRYFEPGPRVDISTIDGVKLGISICEDLWNDRESFTRQLYHDNPVDELAAAGAELFINCSASPYIVRKHAFRLKLMANVARKHKIPMVYCNQVGGNDELVFDGNSCVLDANGKLIAHAKDFEEDLLIADVPVGDESDQVGRASRPSSTNENGHDGRDAHPTSTQTNRIETPKEGLASVYEALVLGLRDYVSKCGFKKIFMGLSGGIDSAVSCAIAVAAIGSENVHGIGMPSRYSSGGSVDDAKELADNLSIKFDVIPIEPGHAAMEGMLEKIFAALKLPGAGVTEENIQARLRGNLMMALSNKTGAMLVTTGNKSEMAVGYCTLYGDMCGGFSVLVDVPKTMVYDLARWINDDRDSPLRKQFIGVTIPVDTITKPPSAELRPDQTDQDSLPEYDVLDEIIERYVEREQSVPKITKETGFDEAVVTRIARLIDTNEYKRKQAAPGLKITGRAFGFGRRMPIAQRYDSNAKI